MGSLPVPQDHLFHCQITEFDDDDGDFLSDYLSADNQLKLAEQDNEYFNHFLINKKIIELKLNKKFFCYIKIIEHFYCT